MSRYIDADALIEYLKKMWGRWDEDDWYEAQAKDAMKDDIEIVNKQPTVDAVPVVRCRECKHAKDENFISAIWCENLEKYLAYDFFCHDGERKDTDKGEQ
jgi:hypothetical protein